MLPLINTKDHHSNTVSIELQQEKHTSEPASNEENEIPVFNIDTLISRMKETKAMGVFTKLSLKNNIDDLIESVQAYKKSAQKSEKRQTKLREHFEGLILKTLSLLNKGKDYTLAEDIYLARDALWNSIMENKA